MSPRTIRVWLFIVVVAAFSSNLFADEPLSQLERGYLESYKALSYGLRLAAAGHIPLARKYLDHSLATLGTAYKVGEVVEDGGWKKVKFADDKKKRLKEATLESQKLMERDRAEFGTRIYLLGRLYCVGPNERRDGVHAYSLLRFGEDIISEEYIPIYQAAMAAAQAERARKQAKLIGRKVKKEDQDDPAYKNWLSDDPKHVSNGLFTGAEMEQKGVIEKLYDARLEKEYQERLELYDLQQSFEPVGQLDKVLSVTHGPKKELLEGCLITVKPMYWDGKSAAELGLGDRIISTADLSEDDLEKIKKLIGPLTARQTATTERINMSDRMIYDDCYKLVTLFKRYCETGKWRMSRLESDWLDRAALQPVIVDFARLARDRVIDCKALGRIAESGDVH